jgi:hypothetical protein
MGEKGEHRWCRLSPPGCATSGEPEWSRVSGPAGWVCALSHLSGTIGARRHPAEHFSLCTLVGRLRLTPARSGNLAGQGALASDG